jgi:RNA polymerase sigma-70 factor (ECF subfamily)
VVQEVFAALWARPELYDPERGSLASFIGVMARSRALDRLRTGVAAAGAVSRLRAVPAPSHTAVDAFEGLERLRALTRAVDQLPDAQRTAVLLRHVRGLGDRELAETTGVPIGTAKSRVRLGTERVREQLRRAA